MPHRSRSLVLRISSWASRQFSRCAAVAQANTMTYTRCHCRSARGNDTTASGHGQPGIPLLGPPRPAVLGHGEGDLGLQVRLGASRPLKIVAQGGQPGGGVQGAVSTTRHGGFWLGSGTVFMSWQTFMFQSAGGGARDCQGSPGHQWISGAETGCAWAMPPAKPKPPDINTVVASATISRLYSR